MTDMKNVLIAGLLMATMTMAAQRGPQGGKERMGKDLTAEQVATLQTKKMTLALALDEKQTTKVYDLMLEDAQDRQAKRAARENKKEEDRPTKEERYAQANKRLDSQIALQKRMKDILTDEQFAKFEKLKMKRKNKNKPKRDKRARN